MTLPARLIEELHPERLAKMLEARPVDEVMHAIDHWLARAEPSISDLATLEVMIQQAERAAEHGHKDALRLGLAGERQRALHRAERRIAEIRLRLYQRIGRFVDSLPEDPGGRVAEGEPIPLRRQARRDLGLDRKGIEGLVALGKAEDEHVEAYVEKIRSGAPIPKDPRAAARAIVRTVYGSGECYTPPHLLTAARRALGVRQFGEDPSTNWAAQTCLVQAKRWRCLGEPTWGQREEDYARAFELDREDFDAELERCAGVDGLAPEPWAAGWWCNPDYASGIVDKFAERAHAEAMAGRAGILLVNAATSAEWQQLMLTHWPRVWLRERVSYYSPTGEKMRGNQWPSVMFGMGVEEHRFNMAMHELGALGLPAKMGGQTDGK